MLTHRRTTRHAAALASGVLALGGVLVTASPAHAEARIGISNDRGTALADDGRATTFTVRGSGFQAVTGGFGGVYVAFGWVRDPAGGGWRPSRGGVTGRDYRYVPDSESGDNAGYLRFVSFPGSSTTGEAQAVMTRAGAFTVSLTVPGPTFRAVDRDGDLVDVDCRAVTCGVITFGAHGLKNARNETFTPIRFGAARADDAAPTQTQTQPTPERSDEAVSAGDGGTTGTGAEPSLRAAGGAGSPGRDDARRGRPTVLTERQTAQAGRALAFTGRGFEPGEQVLALLDDGVVALGPLVAGAAGDVAGVMSLPVDIAGGTHELRLVGAASGARPRERFPVRAAAPGGSADAAPVADDDGDVAATAFVALAGLALTGSLVLLVLRLRLRRRLRRPVSAEAVA